MIYIYNVIFRSGVKSEKEYNIIGKKYMHAVQCLPQMAKINVFWKKIEWSGHEGVLERRKNFRKTVQLPYIEVFIRFYRHSYKTHWGGSCASEL